MDIKDSVSEYFFHPEEGGGIVLTGKSGKSGGNITTTTITNFAVINGKKLVRTRTGSVYEVTTTENSLRWVGLSSRREETYKKLQAAGFTP